MSGVRTARAACQCAGDQIQNRSSAACRVFSSSALFGLNNGTSSRIEPLRCKRSSRARLLHSWAILAGNHPHRAERHLVETPGGFPPISIGTLPGMPREANPVRATSYCRAQGDSCPLRRPGMRNRLIDGPNFRFPRTTRHRGHLPPTSSRPS